VCNAAVASLVEFAPAKINLTLRIGARRADGYHELESLVVFAGIGDRLRLQVGESLSLSARGENAAAAGDVAANLVLKAARNLIAEIPELRVGRFELEKNLPVAAGLGGGSSDAAAALRLLARANPDKKLFGDPRLMAAARRTGADVPVCLDPRPRIMRGIGDRLSECLHLPKLPALLVNPRVSVPTAGVFAARANAPDAMPYRSGDPATKFAERTISAVVTPNMDDTIGALAQSGNDLEAPAIGLHPAIADALAALRSLPGCRLARMSGSGATCFGLFDEADLPSAARTLGARHPHWWIAPTSLG
jgi:4-diphosphocytidyl-2-C-methyl-D-erythritol kinase